MTDPKEEPSLPLHIGTVAGAVGLFLAITYTLCVIFDLIFPLWAMHPAWEKLLPGFTWLSWGIFFLGLVETLIYGVYTGIVYVPLYNALQRKFASRTKVLGSSSES